MQTTFPVVFRNDSFINFTFHFVVNLLTKLLPSALASHGRPTPRAVCAKICVFFRKPHSTGTGLILMLLKVSLAGMILAALRVGFLWRAPIESRRVYWANWHGKARFQFGAVLLPVRMNIGGKNRNRTDFSEQFFPKAINCLTFFNCAPHSVAKLRLCIGWVPLCFLGVWGSSASSSVDGNESKSPVDPLAIDEDDDGFLLGNRQRRRRRQWSATRECHHLIKTGMATQRGRVWVLFGEAFAPGLDVT